MERRIRREIPTIRKTLSPSLKKKRKQFLGPFPGHNKSSKSRGWAKKEEAEKGATPFFLNFRECVVRDQSRHFVSFPPDRTHSLFPFRRSINKKRIAFNLKKKPIEHNPIRECERGGRGGQKNRTEFPNPSFPSCMLACFVVCSVCSPSAFARRSILDSIIYAKKCRFPTHEFAIDKK